MIIDNILSVFVLLILLYYILYYSSIDRDILTFNPVLTSSSLKILKDSNWAPSFFSISINFPLNPHWGLLGVPLINTITGAKLTNFSNLLCNTSLLLLLLLLAPVEAPPIIPTCFAASWALKRATLVASSGPLAPSIFSITLPPWKERDEWEEEEYHQL